MHQARFVNRMVGQQQVMSVICSIIRRYLEDSKGVKYIIFSISLQNFFEVYVCSRLTFSHYGQKFMDKRFSAKRFHSVIFFCNQLIH